MLNAVLLNNVLKAVFKENVSGFRFCARHQLESDKMQPVKSFTEHCGGLSS